MKNEELMSAYGTDFKYVGEADTEIIHYSLLIINYSLLI